MGSDSLLATSLKEVGKIDAWVGDEEGDRRSCGGVSISHREKGGRILVGPEGLQGIHPENVICVSGGLGNMMYWCAAHL